MCFERFKEICTWKNKTTKIWIRFLYKKQWKFSKFFDKYFNEWKYSNIGEYDDKCFTKNRYWSYECSSWIFFRIYWKWSLDLLWCENLTSLWKLKKVEGWNLNLYWCTKLETLWNLEKVEGWSLDLRWCINLTSLWNLEKVEGWNLDLYWCANLTSLWNLEKVGLYLDIKWTNITSLWKLEKVGKYLDLEENIIVQTILKINDTFKEVSKKPDWINNTDVTNQIDGQVEDILWDLEDEYNIKFDNIDEIVAKVRSIGISNYS